MEPATPDLPDFDAMNDEELNAQLGLLCTHMYAAEYQFLRCVRAWENVASLHVYGVKSTAHWLNARCGIAMGAAREKVRVARALPDLPKISEYFARGQISYSKVRAITRVATPENEAFLLSVALRGTASHLERLTAAYRKLEKLNDPERLLKLRRERRLDWYWDDDGMLNIQGKLSPEDGALFIKCIESMRDFMYREEGAADSEDTVERAHGVIQRDIETAAPARRADALLRIMESGCKGEPQALSGPERVQVVLHVPVSDAEADTDNEPDAEIPEDLAIHQQSHLEPGCVVAADTARRLCCDAARVLMVENGKGEPLSVGRLQRTVPWHIRKALMQRDGGCTFSGCTEKRYVDAHHIIHWADGGETSLQNCTMLCRHHHRLVHEEGFGCQRAANGELVFTDPAGNVLSDSFRLHPTTYTSIVDLHMRQQLGISAETALASTEWGHGMDMRMLVDGMISVSHGPNFSYPFPKPLSNEERAAKIARERRLEEIMRERFPLSDSDRTSPRRDPGASSRDSDAA